MIRVVMAIVLGLAAVAGIWWLPARVFDLVVMAAVTGSLYEFGRMLLSDEAERLALIIAGSAVGAVMIFLAPESAAATVALVGAVFALCCFHMWRAKEMGGVAGKIAVSVLGIVYLAAALSMWSWLRNIEFGRSLVMLTIAPSCLCDTFAFLAGKAFGHRKLAPVVSPNKTVEGFIGALAGSVGGAFLVWALVPRFVPWVHVLVIALVIWVLSPMGDLIESMMKRSAGVKDSGTIIPGHGGLLDRLDALTFTGPFVYLYARYVMQV